MAKHKEQVTGGEARWPGGTRSEAPWKSWSGLGIHLESSASLEALFRTETIVYGLKSLIFFSSSRVWCSLLVRSELCILYPVISYDELLEWSHWVRGYVLLRSHPQFVVSEGIYGLIFFFYKHPLPLSIRKKWNISTYKDVETFVWWASRFHSEHFAIVTLSDMYSSIKPSSFLDAFQSK